MVLTVVSVPAQAVVVDVASASWMGCVNVKMGTRVLTAQLLSVMNNAASMEGSVIMESVSSAAQTMRATHARTAPVSFMVFPFAEMFCRLTSQGNTVVPANQVYYSS